MKLILISLLIMPLSVIADSLFTDTAESTLIKSLNHAETGQWQQAAQLASQLQQAHPKFKPAKPLLQLIQNKQLPATSTPPLIRPWTNEYTEDNLLAEITKRWTFSKKNINTSYRPASIIQLADDIDHALIIETDSSRAYLFKNNNGQAEYIADLYIAIGKQAIGHDKLGKQKEGDHMTPIGIYRIKKYKPDQNLQEIYGVGALTLDYPNALDKYKNKTGSGIWLHGVPRDTYSRPPNSSRGCITMSNTNFGQLLNAININTTPVIITDSIIWTEKNANTHIQTALKQWQVDWESRDIERYFSHYSRDFKAGKRQRWQQYKTKINQAKTFINVELNKLSIYQYPKQKNTIVTDFEQSYSSNNYTSVSNKEVIWQETAGEYKIITERTL